MAKSDLTDLTLHPEAAHDETATRRGPHAPPSDAASEATRAMADAVADPASPAALAGFTRLSLHAQGGVGQISLVRDERLGRVVALKELRADREHSSEALRRFANEAVITSQLEHPGIVPIYALANGAGGEPCYVMRFIQGQNLANAIAAHHRSPARAGLRALLQRFVSVCQTMAYAHEHGVIHRDLKPANIMLGGFGETLVLDWGLAKKVLSPESSVLSEEAGRADGKPQMGGTSSGLRTERSVLNNADSGLKTEELTQEGDVLGTPAFMAPEQAAGDTAQVGPAADIYALGGTLYQILANEPPFSGGTIFELVHAVATGRLIPPSARGPRVPRALEAVCLKAMALRPEDRYPSALALAADIDRWLADEPVTALPEPWLVRAGRWARRRQRAAGLLLVFLGTGLVALLISTLLLGQANETIALERDAAIAARGIAHAEGERAKAEGERAKAAERTAALKAREAEATLDFLVRDMLWAAHPLNAGAELTVKAVLDAAAPQLRTAFAQEPAIEARLTCVIGVMRQQLGDALAAEPLLRRGLQLATAQFGPRHPLVFEAEDTLGQALRDQGRDAEAEAIFRRLAADWREDQSRQPPAWLGAQLRLLEALLSRRKTAEAAQAADELAAAWAAQPDSRAKRISLGVTLNGKRGSLSLQRKQLAEAETLFRAAWAEARALQGDEHPNTQLMKGQVGYATMLRGRHDEAVRLFRECLPLMEKRCGPEHDKTLTLMNNIAAGLLRARRFKEAEPVTAEALARGRRAGGLRPELMAQLVFHRALALSALGRVGEAAALFSEAKALPGNAQPSDGAKPLEPLPP